MHAERSDSPTIDAASELEAVVMMVLLAGDHVLWSRAELEREISGVRGNPVDVTDAIDTLYATGLVHLHGELVAPSRAATRMTQLNDV
jgi:hypothetical protein